MKRLNETNRAFIENALNYTDEQKERINSAHTIVFHIAGVMTKQPFDPFKYSTTTGILQQLDEFEERTGILYYIDADTLNICTYAVELDKDLFYAQPHIIDQIQKAECQGLVF